MRGKYRVIIIITSFDGGEVGGTALDDLLQLVDPVHLGAEVLAHEVHGLLQLAHRVDAQLERVGTVRGVEVVHLQVRVRTRVVMVTVSYLVV